MGTVYLEFIFVAAVHKHSLYYLNFNTEAPEVHC